MLTLSEPASLRNNMLDEPSARKVCRLAEHALAHEHEPVHTLMKHFASEYNQEIVAVTCQAILGDFICACLHHESGVADTQRMPSMQFVGLAPKQPRTGTPQHSSACIEHVDAFAAAVAAGMAAFVGAPSTVPVRRVLVAALLRCAVLGMWPVLAGFRAREQRLGLNQYQPLPKSAAANASPQADEWFCDHPLLMSWKGPHDSGMSPVQLERLEKLEAWLDGTALCNPTTTRSSSGPSCCMARGEHTLIRFQRVMSAGRSLLDRLQAGGVGGNLGAQAAMLLMLGNNAVGQRWAAQHYLPQSVAKAATVPVLRRYGTGTGATTEAAARQLETQNRSQAFDARCALPLPQCIMTCCALGDVAAAAAAHRQCVEAGGALADDPGTDLALMFACWMGHTECVRWLLFEVGVQADVFPFFHSPTLPMHAASANGHASCIELLLNAGASANRRLNEFGLVHQPPVRIACAHGHLQALRLLHDAGAELQAIGRPYPEDDDDDDEYEEDIDDQEDEFEPHAIVEALCCGNARVALYVLQHAPCTRAEALAAAEEACLRGKGDGIRLLQSLGKLDDVAQRQIVSNACSFGKPELVRQLLQWGFAYDEHALLETSFRYGTGSEQIGTKTNLRTLMAHGAALRESRSDASARQEGVVAAGSLTAVQRSMLHCTPLHNPGTKQVMQHVLRGAARRNPPPEGQCAPGQDVPSAAGGGAQSGTRPFSGCATLLHHKLPACGRRPMLSLEMALLWDGGPVRSEACRQGAMQVVMGSMHPSKHMPHVLHSFGSQAAGQIQVLG